MKITPHWKNVKDCSGRKLRSDSYKHRDVCGYDHTHRSAAHLKKVSGHVYLLESAEADKRWGRYSF